MQRALTYGLPLALLLSLAGLLILWRPWRTRAGPAPSHPLGWAGLRATAVITLAWAAAILAGFGPERWPPRSASDALPLVLLAAAAAVAFELLPLLSTLMRWLRPLTLAGGLYLLSRAKIANGWPPVEAAAWIGGAAVAGALVWRSLRHAEHEHALAPSLLLAAVAGCAALAAVLTGHLVAPLLAGVLVAVLVPGAVAAWRCPGARLGPAVGLPAAVLTILLFFASAFGDTPWAVPALILAAVGAVGLTHWHDPVRRPGPVAAMIRGAIVLLPALAAVAVALANQPQDPYAP